MLEGLFATIYSSTVTINAFLASAGVSLILGFAISFCYRRVSKGSASMGGALALLPFLVQIVILLVNGNLGAGVAVAGAFSLIRFRSAPGTAQDITTIFLAMTVGLACGMGYLVIAVFAALVVCAILLIRSFLPSHTNEGDRELKVTIPEDLDYTGIFDDLFDKYTVNHSLTQVKTANLGSLYNLHYDVRLKDMTQEKNFIDEMRCRNGNLEIVCGRVPTGKEAL